MAVHAETSTFNLTLFDAHVNLLRTQTEAMSAALGGVDSMTVTPFDKTYETPDEFSERLARNQQLLLKEESHFDKVIDPAAGSYYIENLTVSIAKQAWELFLSVEEAGGFYAALKAGTVQAAVNESNKARHKAVAQRREVLLGTNQFPNFNEKRVTRNRLRQNVVVAVARNILARKMWLLWYPTVLPANSRLCVLRRKRPANVRKRSC